MKKTKELSITSVEGMWLVAWHVYYHTFDGALVFTEKVPAGSFYTILGAAEAFHDQEQTNNGKHLIIED